MHEATDADLRRSSRSPSNATRSAKQMSRWFSRATSGPGRRPAQEGAGREAQSRRRQAVEGSQHVQKSAGAIRAAGSASFPIGKPRAARRRVEGRKADRQRLPDLRRPQGELKSDRPARSFSRPTCRRSTPRPTVGPEPIVINKQTVVFWPCSKRFRGSGLSVLSPLHPRAPSRNAEPEARLSLFKTRSSPSSRSFRWRWASARTPPSFRSSTSCCSSRSR